MTSALRGREGGWSKRDDNTNRLREWDSDKGGGDPKNPKNLRTSYVNGPFTSNGLKPQSIGCHRWKAASIGISAVYLVSAKVSVKSQ